MLSTAATRPAHIPSRILTIAVTLYPVDPSSAPLADAPALCDAEAWDTTPEWMWDAARDYYVEVSAQAEAEAEEWFTANAGTMPRALRREFLTMLDHARQVGDVCEFWQHFRAGAPERHGAYQFEAEYAPTYALWYVRFVRWLTGDASRAANLAALAFRLGRIVTLTRQPETTPDLGAAAEHDAPPTPHLRDVAHSVTAPRGPNARRSTRNPFSSGRVVQFAA